MFNTINVRHSQDTHCICDQQTLEKQQKDKEMLEVRFQKMQSDFEAQLATCDELNSENQSKINELKVSIFVDFENSVLI